MRVFFSFLSILSLSLSLVSGIFDIARSVALTRLTMRPLLQIRQDFFPEYLSGFTAFIQRHFWNGFWESWIVPLLNMPAWSVFLIMSVLFYLTGSFFAQSAAKRRL